MRNSKVIGALIATSVAITPVAASAAPTIGSLATVSGDAFVARQGRLLRAQPAMAVQVGDRVITRTGSTASVALNGCAVSVAGGEMKTFANTSCDAVQSATFKRAGDVTTDASQLHGGLGSGGIVIAFLALGIIAAGIVVVATDGNTRSTSP